MIYNIRGNVEPLTVCLRLVGGDLDEADGFLVVVVMMFRGRSLAGARLLEQERCERKNQENRRLLQTA